MDDDDRPRQSGDAAGRLAGESLDSYSQDELDTRSALLTAELERIATHRARAAAHRLAADAFFKPQVS